MDLWLGALIPNYEALVSALTAASSKVEILTVKESAIKNIDQLVPKKADLVTFKGTMKIHQISWSAKFTHLQARRLTCTECQPICDHYTIGSISSSTKTCALFTNQTLKLCQAFKQVSLEHIHTENILNKHSKFTSQKVY